MWTDQNTWIADVLRDVSAYIFSKTERAAAADASQLTFFNTGMLGTLQKFADGKASDLDQELLRQQLETTERGVSALIAQLTEAKEKLLTKAGGIVFASQIDEILYGAFGKFGIRDRVSEIARTRLDQSYLAELAKAVINDIHAFNSAVLRLGRSFANR